MKTFRNCKYYTNTEEPWKASKDAGINNRQD